MKKEADYKVYFYVLLFAIIFLLILKFDFEIANAMSNARNNFLDAVLAIFTFSLFQVLVFISSSLIVFFNKRKVLGLWLGFAATAAISVILKILIARQRPFQEGIAALDSLIKGSLGAWDTSFPSFHAAFVFAALPFMPKKWFWPWLAFSLIYAFSRFYFGLHYLSDVLAGGAIGFLISYFIIKKGIAK